jgi:rsbT antagonist protein RsbS
LNVPILLIGDVLLVSIQEDLSDDEIIDLQDQIINRVSASRTAGLVIEISAIDMVDSYMARVLNEISSMVSVLGSQTVITGMQPAVAIILVDMGSELIGVKTALNLEKGLDLIHELIEERRSISAYVPSNEGDEE